MQFTDSDGGVAQDFVQKLQMLNSHNSKHELSIEKFLTKSEEAFFDKVKKDKLSSAASIRSSNRDSVWGTPAPSSFDHSSRPSCKSRVAPYTKSAILTFPTAPMGASSFVPGADGYSGPIPGENGEVVMTSLQIALSREFFGWPIYTIIIAAGQVSMQLIFPDSVTYTPRRC